MSDTAASVDDVTFLGGRAFVFDVSGLLGRFVGAATMAAAAVAAVGASAATVAIAGLWMAGFTLSDSPHVQARRPAGPAWLALAEPAAFPKSSFEAKWALTRAVIPVSARVAAARAAESDIAQAERDVPEPHVVLYPRLKVTDEVVPMPPPGRVAKRAPPANAGAPAPVREPATLAPVARRTVVVPMPRPKPVRPSIAQGQAETPAPQIAPVATVPAIVKHKAGTRAPVLSGPYGRTALYDIAGATVYMPDGERLEAHSGLGFRRDNPRYVRVKNQGPTPPNVYKLTLRERLFHGVRAVRMTPADGSKMFGRDGMLAHSYMLGASGQSNGCVSFKDYRRFLQAYLKGEVDRIVVVRNLDETPRQLAGLVSAHGNGGNRFAANELTGSTW